MTVIGTDERPDRVWLIEWTDIFGVRRQGWTGNPADITARIGTDQVVTEGRVTWEDR